MHRYDILIPIPIVIQYLEPATSVQGAETNYLFRPKIEVADLIKYATPLIALGGHYDDIILAISIHVPHNGPQRSRAVQQYFFLENGIVLLDQEGELARKISKLAYDDFLITVFIKIMD